MLYFSLAFKCAGCGLMLLQHGNSLVACCIQPNRPVQPLNRTNRPAPPQRLGRLGQLPWLHVQAGPPCRNALHSLPGDGALQRGKWGAGKPGITADWQSGWGLNRKRREVVKGGTIMLTAVAKVVGKNLRSDARGRQPRQHGAAPRAHRHPAHAGVVTSNCCQLASPQPTTLRARTIIR